MKHSFKFYLLGGAFLVCLSMCLTSCEDVLGHWEKPTPPEFNVTSISLNETSLDLFVEGGEKTATLTAKLVGDPGLHQVGFSSEDPNIATVDEETGEVTAVGGGEVTIYANIGTLQAECKVMVYDRLHNIGTDGAANIPDGKRWMITGDGSDKITINEGSMAYLKNVNITAATGSCIETAGMGEIHLVDGTTNTMKATSNSAAINTAGGQLTIYGQTAGTGKLEANGAAGGAGIGGNKDGKYSTIVIRGGKIEAKGGNYAAGIGSGHCSSDASEVVGSGDIIISGGEVKATGGNDAAGIGTGKGQHGTHKAQCGSIKIEKGVVSVTATKGSGAPDPIGKGTTATSAEEPICGEIWFDTEKVAASGQTGSSAYAIGSEPADGITYGGLTLAISGNTWTLTPAN